MVTEDRGTPAPLPFEISDEICTVDGKSLGTVKEYTHGYFKIDVHLARDYWLSRELILHRVPGLVTLSIGKADVNQWKVRQLDASTEANLGGTEDGLLDADAKRQAREEMERSIDRNRSHG